MLRRSQHTHHAPLPEPPGTDSRIVEITDANFLDRTVGGYTIVDFWAAWCGPCHAYRPVFEAAASRFGGSVRFGSCDIDRNEWVRDVLQIRSIPTTVVFDPDGSEIQRLTGVLAPQQLDRLVGELVPS